MLVYLTNSAGWRSSCFAALSMRSPLLADSVEKLENRGASKISQMSDVGELSYCKALQNG